MKTFWFADIWFGSNRSEMSVHTATTGLDYQWQRTRVPLWTKQGQCESALRTLLKPNTENSVMMKHDRWRLALLNLRSYGLELIWDLTHTSRVLVIESKYIRTLCVHSWVSKLKRNLKTKLLGSDGALSWHPPGRCSALGIRRFFFWSWMDCSTQESVGTHSCHVQTTSSQ